MPLPFSRLRPARPAPPGRRGRLWGAVVSAAALCLVLIPGEASAAPVAGGVAPAGFGTRNCASVQSGDLLMRLDMCTLYYAYPSSGGPSTVDYRLVVQLHSYKWAGRAGWLDSTSQSLTVNRTEIQAAYLDPILEFGSFVGWGQNVSPNSCRHGSPDGPLGCSVPNATRVDFYSRRLFYNIESGAFRYRNLVFGVSWRDERGQAHFWAPKIASPTFVATLS
jgi:hypothetical protein